MAEFYSIQLNSIYLTKTGLANGRACLLTLAGADALLQTKTGQTTQAADGTPYAQIVDYTVGKVLEMRVETIMSGVWEQVVELINNALENSQTIQMIGSGDIGDFSVSVMPLLPRPFEAQEFIEERIRNAVFRFITT